MTQFVHDWVAYHAARQPNAPCVTCVESGVSLSWGDMEYRVARLANRLSMRFELSPGDRVALMCENDTRLFELQFACMRAGLVLVPLSWRLAIGELVTLVRDCSPRLIVFDDAWQPSAIEIADRGAIPHTVRWSDEPGNSGYDELIETGDGNMQGGRYAEDCITHILYTSGTTGLPKGVLCTNGTLKAHALNTAQTSRTAERGNHHLNIVPLFHAGGLNTFTNAILYWGGQVTTIRRFDASMTLQLLNDRARGVTHLCGVLQMYEQITALPEFSRADFPTLRTGLFGGWGPKTVWVHQAWQDRGAFLQLSYGSTEQGPNVSVLEAGQELAAQNCSGFIHSSTELRLVGPDGRDVEPGTVGEIWTRGPAITPGYWQRPRADFFSGDWFRTGDCGRLDEAGRLYIVDRLREVYRSGGENIYPAEVELALADAPGVKEIAIIPIPDDRWGEVGMAIVELMPGSEISLESLQSHAQGRLARFKFPVRMARIDQMPRSATLKIDRAILKKRFGGAPSV